MTRVKTGFTRKRKHNKVLQATKGFRMSYNRLIKRAKEALLHAGEYSYRGRKERKRNFRSLWIQRVNAGLRLQENPLSYSKFIGLLNSKNVTINRKMLSILALRMPESFKTIVDKVRE